MADLSQPSQFCLKGLENHATRHAGGRAGRAAGSQHPTGRGCPSSGVELALHPLPLTTAQFSPCKPPHQEQIARPPVLNIYLSCDTRDFLPYFWALDLHLNFTVIIFIGPLPSQVQVTGTSFGRGLGLFAYLGNRSSHPVSYTGLAFPACFWHYPATTAKICLTYWLLGSNNCIISSIKLSVNL